MPAAWILAAARYVGGGVLASPAVAADKLHLHWLRREPVSVVLAASAGWLRADERFEGEP